MATLYEPCEQGDEGTPNGDLPVGALVGRLLQVQFPESAAVLVKHDLQTLEPDRLHHLQHVVNAVATELRNEVARRGGRW